MGSLQTCGNVHDLVETECRNIFGRSPLQCGSVEPVKVDKAHLTILGGQGHLAHPKVAGTMRTWAVADPREKGVEDGEASCRKSDVLRGPRNLCGVTGKPHKEVVA